MSKTLTFYAICKNEENNIESLIENIQGVDNIFILDTGSTDGTLDILKRLKKEGRLEYLSADTDNFSFHTARNLALFSVLSYETDMYFTMDFDERINTGGVQTIKDNIDDEVTAMSVTFQWGENNVYNQVKVHDKDYVWEYPVHEVLMYTKENEKTKHLKDVIVTHHQDVKKERDYLSMLEKAIQTDYKNDQRMLYYTGREYYYNGDYDKAYSILTRMTSMAPVWGEAHYNACLILSRIDTDNTLFWLLQGNTYCYSRYSLYYIAEYFYLKGLLTEAYYYVNLCLCVLEDNCIDVRDMSFWTYKPYLLAAKCSKDLNKEVAEYNIKIAVSFPDITPEVIQTYVEIIGSLPDNLPSNLTVV